MKPVSAAARNRPLTPRTVATGGRYDGNYGVLAGLEVIARLREAGIAPPRPLCVAFFTNEEGSRFQPGAMGSAVFAGHYRLDDMLAVKDWKGVTLSDALTETLRASPAPMRDGKPGFALDTYVEAHIEQGGLLEAGYQIGCGIRQQDLHSISQAGITPGTGIPFVDGEILPVFLSANASEQLRVVLEPGRVNTVSVTKKEFEGDWARVAVNGMRIWIDGCAGQSFIRSFATFTGSTGDNADVVTYFGVTRAV